MRVKVVVFASARRALGRPELEVSLPAGAAAAALLDDPSLARLRPDRAFLRVAVNEEFSSWEARLKDGDVVALLPPVSGG